MDAGNNGVMILADKMLPPRKLGVLIPGPQAHGANFCSRSTSCGRPATATSGCRDGGGHQGGRGGRSGWTGSGEYQPGWDRSADRRRSTARIQATSG
jgi:hypothetical protein